MSNEKKPIRLTAADFARHSPNASCKVAQAAIGLERLEDFAREKQMKILVTVREVSAVLNVPFDELLGESRLRYEQTLD